jgi:hypothetical protein
MDHRTFEQLAAGAALDDLDHRERLAFETHRLSCPSCSALVDDLLDVTADLALASPPRRPPSSLRDAVMAAVAGSSVAPAGAVVDAAGPIRDERSPEIEIADLQRETRRLRLLNAASLAAAAVLAIAAFGLAVRTTDLADELTASRQAASVAGERLEYQSAAMAVAVDPAHEACRLHSEPIAAGASAVCVYRPGSTESYLMASSLPPTPEGMVYQLWYADEAGVHALGTYDFDGHGAFVAPFTVDLTDAAAVMVTLEPEGGAVGEPGPEVVFGEL